MAGIRETADFSYRSILVATGCTNLSRIHW